MEISDRDVEIMTGIYDAVLDPDAWILSLDRVAERTGVRLLNLVLGDYCVPDLEFGAMSSVMSPELLRGFLENCYEAEAPIVSRMLQFPSLEFVADTELLHGICTYEEFPTLPWLETQVGIRRRTSVRLSNGPSWLAVMTFNCARERGQMNDSERAVARFFLPHFAKAVELMRPLHLLRIRFRAVLAALDRLHLGVLMVDKDCVVVLKNNEARRVIEETGALNIDARGRLRATTGQDSAKLNAAISSATATASGDGTSAGLTLLVRRRDSSEPLLVEVSPVRTQEFEISHMSAALVFVIDPTNRAYVSTKGMRELFDLSGAEAEVCRLMAAGLDIANIAEHRNVQPETVRSQVKQLFQKTGVTRQAGLVRLALSINLPVEESDQKSIGAEP